MYRDNDGVHHQVTSVEVYLPWNDTWVGLADLPVWQHEGSEIKMNEAGMIYLISTGGLFLLGGISGDGNTGRSYAAKKVYDLAWNHSYHSYYWDSGNPDLGKWRGLLLTVTHI